LTQSLPRRLERLASIGCLGNSRRERQRSYRREVVASPTESVHQNRFDRDERHVHSTHLRCRLRRRLHRPHVNGFRPRLRRRSRRLLQAMAARLTCAIQAMQAGVSPHRFRHECDTMTRLCHSDCRLDPVSCIFEIIDIVMRQGRFSAAWWASIQRVILGFGKACRSFFTPASVT
jgi:hypothetical protein